MRHWPAIILAFAAVALSGEAVAQAAASTYHVGEHVQVKPTPWQDIWEEGVVTAFSYDHSQLIIKSASADRAFVDADVRHMQAGGAAPGAGAPMPTPYAAAAPGPAPAAVSGGRNGERVSVAVGGSCCYDGTIVGTGSGAAAGMFLIHYDHVGSQDAYAQPKFIYPFGTRNPNTAPATGRGGKTRCVMSYSGGIPVCLPVAAPG